MLWLVVILGALLVGAVVTVLARSSGGLPPEPDTRRDVLVPAGTPLSADDIGALRFNTSWRGYARDEVDTLLARLETDARVRERPAEEDDTDPPGVGSSDDVKTDDDKQDDAAKADGDVAKADGDVPKADGDAREATKPADDDE